MKTKGLILVATALLFLWGCGKRGSSESAERARASQPVTPGVPSATPHESAPNAAAGVTWTIPSSWKVGPPRPMRVATYLVGEQAECGVFYFGPGEGGDVESNLQRWYAQFKQPDGSETAKKATREIRTISGMKVTVVTLSGTYTNPGGPMMTSQGEKPNYRMLGAIVETPRGNLFYKFVGPEKVIIQEQKNFEALLRSLRLQPDQGR